MKNSMTYNIAFTCVIAFFTYSSVFAQNSNASDIKEANKRLDNYLELRKLGYNDNEIFEDLGNANFLTENYKTALFWYDKLKEVSVNDALSSSYQKRYQYSLLKTVSTSKSKVSTDRDWLAAVKADYQTSPAQKEKAQSFASKFKPLSLNEQSEQFLEDQLLGANQLESSNSGKLKDKYGYKAPITLTANGKTAYFSKAVEVKPLYGVFSKKEVIHKIYKADKINGQWKNIQEIAVCPKYSSAMHPTISADGKRLFFASDMPGTFGKYDIYVSNIRTDGTLGVAMNLGQKVNTTKNDLYPSIVDDNTLFFASDGHKGQGGLDIYMTQVSHKKVDLAVNLGNPINSKGDDFSISLMQGKGMGYVMSNRGKDKNVVQRVAFSFSNPKSTTSKAKKEYNLLAAFDKDVKIDYTSSEFEDE